MNCGDIPWNLGLKTRPYIWNRYLHLLDPEMAIDLISCYKWKYLRSSAKNLSIFCRVWRLAMSKLSSKITEFQCDVSTETIVWEPVWNHWVSEGGRTRKRMEQESPLSRWDSNHPHRIGSFIYYDHYSYYGDGSYGSYPIVMVIIIIIITIINHLILIIIAIITIQKCLPDDSCWNFAFEVSEHPWWPMGMMVIHLPTSIDIH